ncbi:anti-sigma factor [Streptomyces sp. NPDC048111]|uniref:anti-sigma factor n=1 Tax=Streptomyces sp. NPDC048111 TaxID=3365500 RepID=UPI003710FB51
MRLKDKLRTRPAPGRPLPPPRGPAAGAQWAGSCSPRVWRRPWGGGSAAWQHQQADPARDQARSAQARYQQLTDVLAAPNAKATAGQVPGGASGTQVLARSRNQAVFLASGLARPPAGKVYQLWFDDAGTMRSAGLLDPARTTKAVLLSGPVDRAWASPSSRRAALPGPLLRPWQSWSSHGSEAARPGPERPAGETTVRLSVPRDSHYLTREWPRA